MERTEMIILKSVVMDSMKDLGSPWKGNDFQVARARELAKLIDDVLVNRSQRIENGSCDLIEYYQSRAERLNKDPLRWAMHAHSLAAIKEDGPFDQHRQLELLSFCNVFRESFEYVLRGCKDVSL